MPYPIQSTSPPVEPYIPEEARGQTPLETLDKEIQKCFTTRSDGSTHVRVKALHQCHPDYKGLEMESLTILL